MEIGKFYVDFRIQNDVAFTQQIYSVKDVVITNILVKQIGEEVTEHDLKKYFADFGEVVSLTFNDNDLCSSRSANVIYRSPKDAARVLTHTGHKNFTVTANDVWLQPLLDDPYEPDFTNQSKFLTDLVDDTLLHIISYLDVRDQLALALCHVRFSSVFETFAKIKLKNVTTNTNLRPLSAYQIHQYFLLAGNYIEIFGLLHCHINTHLKLYMQLLMKYCPNLKVLLVTDLTKSYAAHFNEVLSGNTQLKALLLHECIIQDECSTAISALPRLELLAFDWCNHITGHQLVLPNLKQLHIINCDNFSEINDNMPALSALSLVSDTGHGFLEDIFENLPQHCKNVEVLNTNCSNAMYEVLAELKNLRSIIIDNTYSGHFLPKLIQHKSDQIQSLGLDCQLMADDHKHLLSKFENLRILQLSNANDDILKALHTIHSLIEVNLSDKKYIEYEDEDIQITNEGLLELVKCCKNLKRVKIENTNINHKFTEDLLPLIKGTKRPNGQLTFFVCGSLIKKEYLSKEYFSEEIQPLVKFVFEEKKNPFGVYKNFFEFDFFSITLPEL